MLLARFGKPDAAAGAARRVVHISRSVSAVATGQETMAAPPQSEPQRRPGFERIASPGDGCSESNAVPAMARPRSHAAWTAIIAGMAIATIVVALGLHSLRRAPLAAEPRLVGNASGAASASERAAAEHARAPAVGR